MIKDQFLSLKYEGLKKTHEITRSQKSMTNIGWKCRKYIKWVEVHEKSSDRNILKIFGDDLIDKGYLNIEYYGDVSRVLLNVQKWRLDKESFSIEPPFKNEWKEIIILITNAKEKPELIISYLNEQGVNVNDFNAPDKQVIFYYKVLVNFFLKSLKGDSLSFFDSNINVFTYENVFSIFSNLYRTFGIELKGEKNLLNLISKLYKDLGLTISIIENLPLIETSSVQYQSVIINYREMNISELFRVSNLHASTYIEINSRNLFVKKISSEVNLKLHFELFIKSLANTYIDLNSIQDELDTFFSYLSLKLNEELRNVIDDLPK